MPMMARRMRPTDRPTDRPLAVDLFCGLGGWTEGLLAAGYRVVGFDIERHVYGEHRYPAQLVIQDVLTIHGSQFKDAALIVASPPCQEYSYMAMPWSRAKQIAADYRSGVRDVAQLTALFDACFRIQREASEAAGHHIPLVVENVRGAQAWVGRARYRFGSFYLWGDVPALMPIVKSRAKRPGHDWNRFNETGEVSPNWRMNGEDSKNKGGGSWFGDTYAERKERWPDSQITTGSKSKSRKAASAQIAKIPFVLSSWIGQAYKPQESVA